MKRVLQYEPRDLTISVEAGLPLSELNALLARNGQMIPLDGPWGEEATVGGVVAANISGERRRLYGTARDLVIGMKFATLEGKLVQSGGMVVKNVAGLDMGKLMIGSFGTLAAIASVNFKLTPRPAVSRTILFSFEDLAAALEARTSAIRGVLNPVAVEILNPVLSAQIGLKNFTVAIIFAGNQAVIERSMREAAAFGQGRPLPVDEEQRFWNSVHSVTPRFLEKFREGAVVRISTTLAECGEALGSVKGPGHAHAASGVVRGWFTRPDAAARCVADALQRGWKAVVEFSSESARSNLALWPEPGADFAIMKKVKRMFDPENLLNRGRLYGQL
jgi:glycolate oxidase FAD binding subunit